jgi:hypothetical protein
MISVIGLIASLRATDPYIETIYTRGSCYKFYLFLKGIWPEAIPVTNNKADHIGIIIDGVVYDINGLVEWNWRAMTTEEEAKAKEWSFAKNSLLQIGECEVCEEPIVV